MPTSLFEGPYSLRHPGERLAFFFTAICALPAALLIGYALHESIGVSTVALFIVLVMVYVTLARGRHLGSSVMVHARQYPRVFAIVKRACAALEIPMPLVFVREDNFVPVATLGFGQPYALVLSSHWIETFEDDELAFMVGRELGHIAAGHTRFLSLLSVNGNENPLIALIFGAWLRRCTYTCDKIGLLTCGSIDAAIRAMLVSAFHEFGRRVDPQAFAEQNAEVDADSVLRWGEWLGAEPYVTYRIASLRAFMTTAAYASARAWFAREVDETPPALPSPGQTLVTKVDCAGWWRRFAALTIDFALVGAIFGFFGAPPVTVDLNKQEVSMANLYYKPSTQSKASSGIPSVAPSGSNKDKSGIRVVYKNPMAAPPAVPAIDGGDTLGKWGVFTLTTHGLLVFFDGRTMPVQDVGFDVYRHIGLLFWFCLYLAVLVAFAGQTFGMLICGLRVVTVDFRRPGPIRTVVRYGLVFVLYWAIAILSIFSRRIMLHDRFTKTRVVTSERMLARASTAR